MLCTDPVFVFGVPRPCGKCDACLINKRRRIYTRCKLEMLSHPVTSFLTLTYDDEHLPEDNSVHKEELQKFFKRLRKYENFRYYAVGEYGDESLRPHYHCLLFGIGLCSLSNIQSCWQFGFISLEPVNDARIRYCTGYIEKKMFRKSDVGLEGREKEFSLRSRRPGLGGLVLQGIDLDDENLFARYNQNEGFINLVEAGNRNLMIDRYIKERLKPTAVTEYNEKYARYCFSKKGRKFVYSNYDTDHNFGVDNPNEYVHYCRSHYLPCNTETYRDFYKQRLLNEAEKLKIFKMKRSSEI